VKHGVVHCCVPFGYVHAECQHRSWMVVAVDLKLTHKLAILCNAWLSQTRTWFVKCEHIHAVNNEHAKAHANTNKCES